MDNPNRAALAQVMTADQFRDYFLGDVVNEADFTETFNEDRTLGDYLADLATLIERTLTGERLIVDPRMVAVRPADRWVRAGDLAEIITATTRDWWQDEGALPPTGKPAETYWQFTAGAWLPLLALLGVDRDAATDEDGLVGGRDTQRALTAPSPLLPKHGQDVQGRRA